MEMEPPDDSDQVERLIRDLWHFYDEHAAQARQHETLRATVTSILAGFAAALVGFAGVGGLEQADAPAGALLIAVGLLGAPIGLKHYERNRLHTDVMHDVREEITRVRRDPKVRTDPGHGPASPGELRDCAEKRHNSAFSLRRKKRKERPKSWLVRVHLWQLWAVLRFLILVAGVVILVFSLISDK